MSADSDSNTEPMVASPRGEHAQEGIRNTSTLESRPSHGGPPQARGAVFDHDGGWFLPTPLAAGPWSPDAQHGGAAAALLARAIEAHPAARPMHVARLTVEFLGPVPLSPLRVLAETTRRGARTELVRAEIKANGVIACRATALRIRKAPEPISSFSPRIGPPPGPEDAPPTESRASGFAGIATEQRFVAGSWAPGPATVWIRLRQPLVAGERPSPLVRLVAAADFANGVGSALSWDSHVFINPDLSVYLDRTPAGEWICLEASTRVACDGTGTAESRLFDVQGQVGRGLQALYVERK